MKMSLEERQWWRVQIEQRASGVPIVPILYSKLRDMLDDLDEAEIVNKNLSGMVDEIRHNWLVEVTQTQKERDEAEARDERWKKVVDLACGSGCHTLHRHDNMTDDQLMREFYLAAQKGDLDALEIMLGIKKEDL